MCVDFGATSHLCDKRNNLFKIELTNVFITVVNGDRIKTKGKCLSMTFKGIRDEKCSFVTMKGINKNAYQ